MPRPRIVQLIALVACGCLIYASAMITPAINDGRQALNMYGSADVHQNAPALSAALQKAADGPYRLAAYRYFRESFVYYTGGPVARCHSAEDLSEFLASSDDAYVFTVDEHEELLAEKFPDQFEVVARRPRFLGRGEVVLLGRRANRITPQRDGDREITAKNVSPDAREMQTAERHAGNTLKK